MLRSRDLPWLLLPMACTEPVAGFSGGAGTSAAQDTGPGPVSSSGGDSGATSEGGSTAASAGDGPKFDLAGDNPCADAPEGIVCVGTDAVTCDADGEMQGSVSCAPGVCESGVGCAACVEGQVTCVADRFLACDASVQPAVWIEVEVCDPAAGEGCDLGAGGCAVLEPIGGTQPTGVYYKFADFAGAGDGYLGGYDVDGHGDRLYVRRHSGEVDVYQITLLDSDGDGALEPNQHPDNPDHPGEIEQRVLQLDQTLAIEGGGPTSASELYVDDARVVIGGFELTQNSLMGAAPSVISTAPAWLSGPRFEQIGYDDLGGLWYASNQQHRRVLQYDPATDRWGIAFEYPALAGDHMDGLEVVRDPDDATVYVYVSDMTSDFIGQYRFDPVDGWVQQNVFAYDGGVGVPVEGLGFGPLNHFWATGAAAEVDGVPSGEVRLYELGGGTIASYTEPAG